MRRPHAVPERRRNQGLSESRGRYQRTAWRHTVYNGKILAIPIHRPAVTSLLFRNKTVWDQEFGKDACP